MELTSPELVVCTLPQADSATRTSTRSTPRPEARAPLHKLLAPRGRSAATTMALFSRIAFPGRTASMPSRRQHLVAGAPPSEPAVKPNRRGTDLRKIRPNITVLLLLALCIELVAAPSIPRTSPELFNDCELRSRTLHGLPVKRTPSPSSVMCQNCNKKCLRTAKLCSLINRERP
jgi:hypothetical protein